MVDPKIPIVSYNQDVKKGGKKDLQRNLDKRICVGAGRLNTQGCMGRLLEVKYLSEAKARRKKSPST